MVAVVGVSSSAQANLLAEIDRLGTNLLTVAPGQDLLGNSTVLPTTAAPMINGMRNVQSAVAIYQIQGINVYRTPFVPSVQTGGIGIDATGENLPRTVGTTMRSGHFLTAAANRYPEAVLDPMEDDSPGRRRPDLGRILRGFDWPEMGSG
jgi:putative ABC transport system permease protein